MCATIQLIEGIYSIYRPEVRQEQQPSIIDQGSVRGFPGTYVGVMTESLPNHESRPVPPGTSHLSPHSLRMVGEWYAVGPPTHASPLTIHELMLRAAGWHVVDPGDVNLCAFRGTAIRNFTLKPGHGFADYLLCVDGKVAGAPARRGPW
jgi:hypothetical protein